MIDAVLLSNMTAVGLVSSKTDAMLVAPAPGVAFFFRKNGMHRYVKFLHQSRNRRRDVPRAFVKWHMLFSLGIFSTDCFLHSALELLH